MKIASPQTLTLPMMNSKNPEGSEFLQKLGNNIYKARTIRAWSLEYTAKQAGVVVNTLIRIEAGDERTGIGKYNSVLKLFGFDKALGEVGSPESDIEGEKLRRASLKNRPKQKRRGKLFIKQTPE